MNGNLFSGLIVAGWGASIVDCGSDTYCAWQYGGNANGGNPDAITVVNMPVSSSSAC